MTIQEEALERLAENYLETDRFARKLPMISAVLACISVACFVGMFVACYLVEVCHLGK